VPECVPSVNCCLPWCGPSGLHLRWRERLDWIRRAALCPKAIRVRTGQEPPPSRTPITRLTSGTAFAGWMDLAAVGSMHHQLRRPRWPGYARRPSLKRPAMTATTSPPPDRARST